MTYGTADGTATAGSDYQTASGTLTFAPGEISKTITVLVYGDTLVEGDEGFAVSLSSAVGATILDGQGTCTIVNDDVPPPPPPPPASATPPAASCTDDLHR